MRSHGSDQRITRRESMLLRKALSTSIPVSVTPFPLKFSTLKWSTCVYSCVCLRLRNWPLHSKASRFWCARTNKLEAVRIQDYNQWDKFVHKDLDKILDDFDENDRQEQEETHR